MKKTSIKNLKYSIPIIISFSFSAFANELEIQKFVNEYDKSNSIILEEITVTASKIPMELSKTGSSVEIISRNDIEDSDEIFLIDYLNSLSGVSIDQNGPPGMLSGIKIRGSSAQYAKVLLDGIDITNTSGVTFTTTDTAVGFNTSGVDLANNGTTTINTGAGAGTVTFGAAIEGNSATAPFNDLLVYVPKAL